MPSESTESPFRPPSEVNESNPNTPGVLGMFGAVVISGLAGGGACCGSCFGSLFLLEGAMGGGFELGIIVCGLTGLVTFGVVLFVLSRTIDAAHENAMANRNDQMAPPARSNLEADTNDSGR